MPTIKPSAFALLLALTASLPATARAQTPTVSNVNLAAEQELSGLARQTSEASFQEDELLFRSLTPDSLRHILTGAQQRLLEAVGLYLLILFSCVLTLTLGGISLLCYTERRGGSAKAERIRMRQVTGTHSRNGSTRWHEQPAGDRGTA